MSSQFTRNTPDALNSAFLQQILSEMGRAYRSETENSPFYSVPATSGETPLYNSFVSTDRKSAEYQIALPGYQKEDIKVTCTEKVLTVSGDVSPIIGSQKPTDHRVLVRMFKKSPFKLSWNVPSGAVVDSAKLSDGVLCIKLSRKEDPSTTIPIL
ncbi:Hsp20/alpha crystallin family protein [bacterium]|nr:Hsp20/alpha crystallin family protein [bacterium]